MLSFALSQTEKVEELTTDHRTIVGVSTIQRTDDRYAIRLFTLQPEPTFNRIALSEQLAVSPEDIELVVTEGIFALNEPVRDRTRPAPIGCSVGHFQAGTGTLGSLVRDSERTYILSNNHVLANENRAAIDDPILQPGPFDNGQFPADIIARLSRFVPIDFAGINQVDAAIATVDNIADVINSLPSSDPFIGSIRGITTPTKDMIVAKYGRTTGLTVGKIVSLKSSVQVNFDSGSASFTDQLLIEGESGNFSERGDSGSVIVDVQSKRAVGLLFAGDSTTGQTFANPISNVLRALNVAFV